MGRIRGRFSGMHRTLDGWIMARVPASPAQVSIAMGLGITVFFISTSRVALGKLG